MIDRKIIYRLIFGFSFFIIALSLNLVSKSYAQDVTLGGASNLPVPRFVSLKSNSVNVRAGPGRNYDVAWTFTKAGLPVEVVAEFENWRKIRDSEGEEGWVFHGLVSGRRTVLISPWEKEKELPARLGANNSAKAVILLQSNVLADIRSCDGQWCLIAARNDDGAWEGWARQDQLWGVYPDEIIE